MKCNPTWLDLQEVTPALHYLCVIVSLIIGYSQLIVCQIAAVTFTVTLCDEVDIIITFYRKGDIDSTWKRVNVPD